MSPRKPVPTLRARRTKPETARLMFRSSPASSLVKVRGWKPDLFEAVDTAANEAATSPQNDRPEPTDAQKEAENYPVGSVRRRGLSISIENPKGSYRFEVDREALLSIRNLGLLVNNPVEKLSDSSPHRFRPGSVSRSLIEDFAALVRARATAEAA